MPKEFRLTLAYALPSEAFAEAAALVAIQPVVKGFMLALADAKIEGKINHEVVAVRGKKKAAATAPRAVA
jgi:hypothetical protein